MSSRPQLEGIHEEPKSDEVVRLRREIAGLERELQDAKDEASKSKAASVDAIHAIRALRKNLEPFYLALKMIFGEISRVDADTTSSPAGSSAPTPNVSDPRWESWKSRVGERAREIIDLLLVHRAMNTSQLAAAMHRDKRTVGNAIYELNKASILVKNGNNFSLKELP